jgi:hypothetical protein
LVVHAVALVAGAHSWQALVGLSSPLARSVPEIQQPVTQAAATQTSPVPQPLPRSRRIAAFRAPAMGKI